ncbi:16S rRNA (guanine(966)-N(2))-methyltransferase RsmD [bacterium]|nr:16S rRNA (guanine(966)-N(2))-methyltransferase RsmD [bacterium]
MRVIAGKAKGRRLCGPKSDATRPALDSVKEAIFNILFDVEGTRVLDIFAGTGSIGIEALSRGAKSAVFIENSSEAVKIIKKNLDLCSFSELSSILCKKAEVAIKILSKSSQSFDLIFVDPPYNKDLVNETLSQLSKSTLLNNEAIIVVEHHPNEPIDAIDGLNLYDQRKYGQTLISFLKKNDG